jgi:2-polyprenyl-3-methyl-5-hydroxy-6-metoxy-1,4-benzoquinol methylase
MIAQQETSHGITERLGPGSPTWVANSADHLARYLHAAGMVQGRRVLDAGCGLGYGAAILKEAGALRVQAVDIDEPSIVQARNSYPIDGLDYRVDDCETLANVDGPFDLVCNFENIEHLQHPDRFLQQAARLLTDEGALLCSTPEPDPNDPSWAKNGRPTNPFHVTEWNREEFRALLSQSFSDVVILAEVELLSSILRREAVLNLERHLCYLWSQPLIRLSRGIERLIGRSRDWPSVSHLVAQTFHDFRIVPASTAAIYGQTTCHFAVCRSPRR